MPAWLLPMLIQMAVGAGTVMASRLADSVGDTAIEMSTEALQSKMAELFPNMDENSFFSRLMENYKMQMSAQMTMAINSRVMDSTNKMQDALEQQRQKIRTHFEEKINKVDRQNSFVTTPEAKGIKKQNLLMAQQNSLEAFNAKANDMISSRGVSANESSSLLSFGQNKQAYDNAIKGFASSGGTVDLTGMDEMVLKLMNTAGLK